MPRFHVQPDDFILNIGLCHLVHITLLFYSCNNDKKAFLVAKIVEELLFTGLASHVELLLKRLDSKFRFGIVISDPGVFNFYGMTIEQIDDYSLIIHADTRANALACLHFLASADINVPRRS